MFYSKEILGKKGPLAIIWLAATLEKRLKREQVSTTNVAGSAGALQLSARFTS